MINVMVHNYYDILNKNNNMFKGIGDETIQAFLKQMLSLKDFGNNNGVSFNSSDVVRIENVDMILFIDYPNISDPIMKLALDSGKPLLLMVWESGIINLKNIDYECHGVFEKVFTYDDSVVDGIKYIKIAYTSDFPTRIDKDLQGKAGCCLIAANKYSFHPLELYTLRAEIIHWFEKNANDFFDFYGRGWGKVIPPKHILDKILNRSECLNKIRARKYLSYCGEIGDKYEILRKYKFSICFENAKDLTGYVSEKIFDCFISGCVPVYLGAENINELIPEGCFIDYRQFNSIEAMYHCLRDMPDFEYIKYLNNIEKFITCVDSKLFTNSFYSQVIVEHIKNISSQINKY